MIGRFRSGCFPSSEDAEGRKGVEGRREVVWKKKNAENMQITQSPQTSFPSAALEREVKEKELHRARQEESTRPGELVIPNAPGRSERICVRDDATPE